MPYADTNFGNAISLAGTAMRQCWPRLLAAILAFAVALAAHAKSAPGVERLAALPHLTGTPPAAPVWSPDGSLLLFLWNDVGEPGRDVWIVAADSDAPRQLTKVNGAEPLLAPFGEHLGTDLSLDALTDAAFRRYDGGVSEALWGPEGERIFFVHDGRVQAVNIASGTTEVVAAGEGPAQLSVSPDGRRLTWLDGGDLWFKDLERDFVVKATNVGVPTISQLRIGRFPAPDVEFDRYAWSADSRHVALRYIDRRAVRRMPVPSYMGEEPALNQVRRSYPGDDDLISKVGIYRVSDGVVRYLDLPEANNRNVLDLAWSPAAPRLLVQQDSHEGEYRWLYAAAPSSEPIEILSDHRPNRIYSAFNATWSADGRRIIYVDDNDGYYRLKTISPDGGRSRILTDGDYDVAGSGSAAPLVVPPGANEVFFTAAAPTPYVRHVFRIPAAGGKAERVTMVPGLHEQLAVSSDGRHIAVVSTNDRTPYELYVKSVGDDSAERRITRSPPDEFYEYNWVEPRYVTFPSRIDDFTLHARVLEPPDLDPGKKYPVIIGNVYSNSVRNAWSAPRQISALQQMMAIDGGYIVVQVDLRGSMGYGVEFRESFQGDWGGGDLEDLHSTVDWLKTLAYVDSDRIGIWGNSYGGMMVLFALFEKPGMFAAGVAGAPAIDVQRFTGNDQHLSRRPQTHPEIFRDSTLLNYGENLEDPLMFIHGLHDDIVPFSTTLKMMEKLMLLGKDFDVAIMPTSAHWWAYPEHYAVYSFRKLMQFFDRHLKVTAEGRD